MALKHPKWKAGEQKPPQPKPIPGSKKQTQYVGNKIASSLDAKLIVRITRFANGTIRVLTADGMARWMYDGVIKDLTTAGYYLSHNMLPQVVELSFPDLKLSPDVEIVDLYKKDGGSSVEDQDVSGAVDAAIQKMVTALSQSLGSCALVTLDYSIGGQVKAPAEPDPSASPALTVSSGERRAKKLDLYGGDPCNKD